MKKVIGSLVAASALALLGARALTEHQAVASGVLQELQFESVESDNPEIVGAPPQFRVTKKTIKHLQVLMKNNETITVDGDGNVHAE